MTDTTSTHRDPTEPIRPRRPILLRLVLWVYGLWVVLGWLRFFGAISNRALIFEFLPAWAFWYLLSAGLIWGLMGIPVLWGIFRRAGWTLNLLPIGALAYPLVYWLERLLFWQSPVGRSNWPFMLLLTVLWLGLVVRVRQSTKVRQYFGYSQERD